MNLTIEQQFQLASFKSLVAQMSQEQASSMAVEVYKQMLIREKIYQGFLNGAIALPAIELPEAQ